MLYIKIHYGLGNQMFQYALGRRLSLEKQVNLKLDISYYSNNNNVVDSNLTRYYQLNIFNIQEDIATDIELSKFTASSFYKRQLNKVVNNLLPVRYHGIIREEDDVYDPRVFNCADNTYLFGYWQDERYFKSIETIIRQEFTFKFSPDPLNIDFINKIKNEESVNIHVRRTDYITDIEHNKKVGSCDLEYYKSAVDFILEKVHNPHFFIFSDDPEWTKNNLNIRANVTYITHNSIEKGYEDLRLMINCKHHIIANSSFSWWAAWLADYPDKIVIAPRIWQIINNEKRKLPDKWIRL